MALKNNFFTDTLYELLSLEVSASEEEIQKAYNLLKTHVDRGFMVTEEDKVKIAHLEFKLFDPEFRLHSMILKGSFGSDELDLQLERLKKILAAKRIVAQEWIDLESSLYALLQSNEFSNLLLSLCPLTKNAGPSAQNILTKTVDSLFQTFVDFQVSGVENAFKNSDRNTALEYLNIVKNFSGISTTAQQKALETMLECFWKSTQKKIAEIKDIKKQFDSEKSEYNIKALVSRIEQETKDGLIPVHDLFIACNFQNQKKYLDEIRAVLEMVIRTLKESSKSEKADFFIAKLNGQKPVENTSPLSTTSILRLKKTSEKKGDSIAKTEKIQVLVSISPWQHRIQFILRFILILILISLSVAAFLLLIPNLQKEAEENYTALCQAEDEARHRTASPEERLSQNLKFLSQTKFRQTDMHLQILQETTEFIFNRLKIYESQGKLHDFINRMSTILKSLDQELKLEFLQKIAPHFEQYFLEHHFKPENFFLWWLKIGTYGMAQDILSKRIFYSLKKQDLKDVHQSLEIARKHSIPLPGNLATILLKKDIVSKGLSLLLVSHFSELPEKVWRTVILELWELSSSLSDEEGLLVLEKVGGQFPDLRVDLLQLVLDKSRNNRIPWPEKLGKFQNASVEKRIKLLACYYSVQRGDYEGALKLSKTLPVPHENNTEMYLPLFFIEKQYFRIRYLSEKILPSKTKPQVLNEFYEILKGLAYARTGEPKKAVSILEPVMNLRFQDYLLLWKSLHEREAIVRKMLIKKWELQTKLQVLKGADNNKEAVTEKEKFILSEIANDPEVKKMKTKITDNHYVYEGIFGWIESSLQLKNTVLLSKIEARLKEMKNVFFEPKTEIILGQVCSLLGKQSEAEKIFQDVEQSCFHLNNYLPLLDLCNVYEQLSLDVALKKLTKNILKKCKDSKICDDLYRFLVKNTIGDDTIIKPQVLELLNKIQEKKVTDKIQIMLLEIEQEKNTQSDAPLIAQLEKMLQDSKLFFNTDQFLLLAALGDQCFLLYRLTHSADALNKAIYFFKQALLFYNNDNKATGASVLLEIKILHTLWFRILDNIFAAPDLHFLSDDFTLPYWHAIASKSESKQNLSLVDSLNANPDFSEIRGLVEKILSQKNLWASPPIFFELLSNRGVRWDLLPLKDLSEIKKVSFSKFWAWDAITRTFLDSKRRTFLFVEKSESDYLKDRSPQNADYLLKESETALFDWISKNVPIPTSHGAGDFETLWERVEFSKFIKPSLRARKLILDIKLTRMAFLFDPDREWIGTIPVPWVVAKFVKEGQTSRNSELQFLLEEAKLIQKEVEPFFLEDLCGLQAKDLTFVEKLSPKIQNLINLEIALNPNTKKTQVGIQLFKKKS